jgi:hypothetical protein
VPFGSRQTLSPAPDSRVAFRLRNFTPEQVLHRPQPRSIGAILERLALSKGARFVARSDSGEDRAHRKASALQRRHDERVQMVLRLVEILDDGAQAIAPPPLPGI